MSPRNRERYLAEREDAVELVRARAIWQYLRTHITREVGAVLADIRAARLQADRESDG